MEEAQRKALEGKLEGERIFYKEEIGEAALGDSTSFKPPEFLQIFPCPFCQRPLLFFDVWEFFLDTGSVWLRYACESCEMGILVKAKAALHIEDVELIQM